MCACIRACAYVCARIWLVMCAFMTCAGYLCTFVVDRALCCHDVLLLLHIHGCGVCVCVRARVVFTRAHIHLFNTHERDHAHIHKPAHTYLHARR